LATLDADPRAARPELTAAAPAAHGSAYRWWVVFLLFLAYTLGSIDTRIMTLMFGEIRADLKLGDFEMSLLQGFATVLFVAVAGVPVGRIVDRIGSRGKFLALGVVFWSLATALCGLARSFGQLFLGRVAVGVGETTLGPSAYSLISDYFGPRRRALAISVYALGYPVGGGLGLVIGGLVLKAAQGWGDVILPWIGLVRPWQMAFFIVGLPGLVVALLVASIREPARQAPPPSMAEGAPSLREAAAFLVRRRRIYASLMLATGLLGTLAIGTAIWYPTFLIRTYGMTPSEAGYAFGTLMIVCGVAGNLSGGWLSGALMARGMIDANPRIMIAVTLAKVVPLVVGPLMPNATLALACMGLATFIGQFSNGVAFAALQDITPSRMRGQVSALAALMVAVLGTALGSSLIAAVTQFVFGQDGDLRYSISLCAAVIAPVAALLFFVAMRPYREAIAEMEGPAIVSVRG